VKARIRAYVVDDEPLAVQRLSRLLEATRKVDVVGTATDPDAALEFLVGAAEAIDAVFLDVEMPATSGIDLAARLPRGPAIVFVTAHESFALRAFEVSAVDYLMKPVRATDLDRALAKIERLRPAHPVAGEDAPERVASRLGDRIQLVELAKVTYFAAEDKLTSAVTAERSYVVDASIADLEQRLARAGFFRIHRATLVNLAYVGELFAAGAGAFVRLTDAKKTELQVARDRVRPLKTRLGI
jgi:two-component system LytT family response regulator